MIRDLRYEEIERAAKRKRLVRLTLGLVLASAAGTFAVRRERQIHEEWTSLPVARDGDVESLRARRDAIGRMVEERAFWTGMFRATSERDELAVAIANEERLVARAEEQVERQARRKREEIEAARTRAIQFVYRHEYDRAIEEFRRALDMAGPDWEHTAQVKIDLEALEKLKERQAGTGGGGQ